MAFLVIGRSDNSGALQSNAAIEAQVIAADMVSRVFLQGFRIVFLFRE